MTNKLKYFERFGKVACKRILPRFVYTYLVVCVTLIWMEVEDKHNTSSFKNHHLVSLMFTTDVGL